LVEKGTPLSQVRDLLGHASITTTERYDNQRPEALMEAAKRLDTGETFTIPSQSRSNNMFDGENSDAENDPNVNTGDGLQRLKGGVGDGGRTRDFRSHSPALYR
jgi:hypothetical protein